ncbi:MAG: shikimate kinase, partial [Candidatus Thorarchaeota archaeon]
KKVSKLNNVVISCGGGVVINPENIENLRKNCCIILLRTSIEEIYKRILKNGKKIRPLIKKKDTLEELKTLFSERQPLYESAADLVIDTSEKKTDKIVDVVIFDLKQLGVI